MYDIDQKNQKSLNNIISITKLVQLLFCALIFVIHFSKINETDYIKYIYFSENPVGIVLFSLILIYLFFSFSSMILKTDKISYAVSMIENLFFIIMFSIIMFSGGKYVFQYKLLFLSIIITATLQLGMKHGIITALISSIIISIFDLMYFSNWIFNKYFENDTIIFGMFFLVAISLGHYVKLEQENLDRKDMQLTNLNNELIHENKNRKYIEQVLSINEICSNLIIKNCKDAIFVHYQDKLFFVNDSALELLEFSIHQMKDKTFFDFIPVTEKEKTRKILNEIYNKKKTLIKYEGRLVNKDGEFIQGEFISSYFTYAGNAVIITIVNDISSKKQVEQLRLDVEKNVELLNESREFNNSIIELFANISHELKTPLNVIYSAVQVLGLYKNDSKTDHYIKIMKQNCYRLMKLIGNFLDITKLDAGFLKINLANYDIVKTVEDITLSVTSYTESKNINLIFDTNVEEKVMAFDADKMERIMLNLLSNAVKYSNPGGEILVTLLDKEDKVYISIKDTGLGIPEDKVKLVFERFGQVDRTIKRIQEGSGIGLSLVKSFVEMQNGTIELKSQVNVGSEFIIMLPVKLVHYCTDDKNIGQTNIERIDIEFSDIYTDN